jgi:hypothetical protein
MLREQGKSVKRAEDFFQEETQETLQTALTEGLKDYLEPKGIIVSAVLIRRPTKLPRSTMRSRAIRRIFSCSHWKR